MAAHRDSRAVSVKSGDVAREAKTKSTIARSKGEGGEGGRRWEMAGTSQSQLSEIIRRPT